ncbi:proline rich protein 5MeD [Apiospora aurea]|uniref:Proline rich protein 5MeD n=1 Tax=Apiospora aurea TaxID=335848 RepID=A0ABR1QJY2_9PEZI
MSTSTVSSTSIGTSSSIISTTSIAASSSISSSTAPSTSSVGYVTTTQQYTGLVATTTTIPPSGTVSGTVIIRTPLPTFSCDPNGYLVQRNGSAYSLSRVNIPTGNREFIRQGVGTGAAINAMGYNSLDNYLYAALGSTPGNLLRIGSNGDSQTLASLGLTTAVTSGDVDENGYYWATAGGKQWWQYDVRPGSATFGQLVTSGTANPGMTILLTDWAYAPNPSLTGANVNCCLYAIAYDDPLAVGLLQFNTYLLQFNRTTKAWAQVRSFGAIKTNVGGLLGKAAWGALYAATDGFLYCTETGSGEIWRFPLAAGAAAPTSGLSKGPASSNDDGARCITAGAV